MSEYFPFFCSLNGQDVFIIGGNDKALEKIRIFLPFKAKITVIADKTAEIPTYGPISVIPAKTTDIAHLILQTRPKAVILADETLADTKALYDLCVKNRIELNTADRPEWCTFIFPSMICRDKLTVAVSTGGASPAAAVRIRKDVEERLPSEIDAILDWLEALRPAIKGRSDLDKPTIRTVYHELVRTAFEQNRPLDAEETERTIQNLQQKSR